MGQAQVGSVRGARVPRGPAVPHVLLQGALPSDEDHDDNDDYDDNHDIDDHDVDDDIDDYDDDYDEDDNGDDDDDHKPSDHLHRDWAQAGGDPQLLRQQPAVRVRAGHHHGRQVHLHRGPAS